MSEEIRIIGSLHRNSIVKWWYLFGVDLMSKILIFQV